MAPAAAGRGLLRRVAAPAALVAVSVLIAVGALEVLLRIIYPPPARFFYPQESYTFDSEIGHTLKPRQAAFTHDRPVQTNALGLRDHEVTPEPAPGTVRILALGDSQTFGNGLSAGETWPKDLERALQLSPGDRRWEVINAGIPGTDTWQHELLLRRLMPASAPTAVVLALYVNDVVPRHDPRSVEATAQTNSTAKRLAYLAKRSAVVTWVYHRVLLPRTARSTGEEGSVEQAVLAGTRDPRAERGWHQVEQSLGAMRKLCDATGTTLLVAILPRRDQVAGRISGLAYTERARAVTAAVGLEAVDLLPSLAAEYRARGDALFVPWDGHNSAIANRVIAARLAEKVLSLTPPLLPRAAGR